MVEDILKFRNQEVEDLASANSFIIKKFFGESIISCSRNLIAGKLSKSSWFLYKDNATGINKRFKTLSSRFPDSENLSCDFEINFIVREQDICNILTKGPKWCRAKKKKNVITN